MTAAEHLPLPFERHASPCDARFSVYREAIAKSQELGDNGRASYYLANLALEEVMLRTNNGEEPFDSTFDRLEHRFALSADLNRNNDKLLELRSRLLGAWIRPIVWSGVINLDGLSSTEARNVSHVVHLEEAGDETAAIAQDALMEFDQLNMIPASKRDEEQVQTYKYLVGFLNEATPILLGSRHTTAKQFAMPSTAYDDDVNPDTSQHFDGIYLDNRKSRTHSSQYSYHVTSTIAHHHITRSIPEINARIMGNLSKSSRWPHDDHAFITTRNLVLERQNHLLDEQTLSTLDSISSAVFNTIAEPK